MMWDAAVYSTSMENSTGSSYGRRAFAKSVVTFVDGLKPKTQNLTPINCSLEPSLDRAGEGKIYRSWVLGLRF